MSLQICARESCACRFEAGEGYEVDGVAYCTEMCAKECTDEQCVCTPCECAT